ncbi:MAG: hypothetical protein WC314_10250 [Vulcanimicrobiota bacterium]
MVKLYSSYSSEFFAVREPGRIQIFKDSFQDVAHRVHDKMAGELIHLSDSGECFFRSTDGLFRLRREKGVRADRCKAVKGMDGSPERGILAGFAVRADGEQVAYEQIVPAQKFSSKLKRFLGSKSAQGDVGPRLHRFVVSQWSGRSSTCYYETVIDPRTSLGLVWWPSPDFGFLSVMERERDNRSYLRLIDILDESVVNELVVEGRLSRDRFLTTNGSVGFGMEKDGKRAFVIWTYSQERFGVSYPKDSRVVHLLKDKVIFLSKKQEIVTAKDYQNNVVLEVSLRSLTELGIQYLLSFNPRGSLELVTYAQGRLRVHHTDLESLPIDARRWELLGERRRAAELESAADDVLKRDQEQRAVEEQQSRQSRLVHEMNEHVSKTSAVQPMQSSLPFEATLGEGPSSPSVGATFTFGSKEEAEDALEKLRMRYIAGELTREDYYNEKTVIEKAAASI